MTRHDQWAAAARTGVALAAVVAITATASVEVLAITPGTAGLLYLLPVLWVSARGGMNAGLVTAVTAAMACNFFLLAPRYTFGIHGVADVAAFVVLTVVALVTSRLASDLRRRELEAEARARSSAAEAALTAALAPIQDRVALDAAALANVAGLFGEAHLIDGDAVAAGQSGLSPLDAAAAAWALNHGAVTGAGTEVMPAADARFVPLGAGDVLAIGERQSVVDAVALTRIWAQARDRLTASDERRARAAAETREAVRRTLLAALGHDFRTPLTVLKAGLAELDTTVAARLGREVDRLVRLSADLIAAARLDGGGAVALEAVDLVDIVAAVLPAEADAAIDTAVPADLPLVHGEPVMLVHLLGNLLDNARRHARARVTIAARATSEAVLVEVSDDGPGIDPAIAGHLFDRFVAGSDRDGGSGLGLAIVRDLATAMGATVAADTGPGGGARFTVALRAVPA